MIANSRSPLFATILTLVALMLLVFGVFVDQQIAQAQGTILRVNAANNASSGNDGSTWDKAFLSLQDALAVANSGAAIWVAKGVYYPDEGIGKTNDSINERFTLKSDVAIYGGFAGTETQLSQRNFSTNVTILSGDIQKNDTTGADKIVTDVAQIVGTNSINVVYASSVSGARLDGFVITGGAAIQNSSNCPGACGGGLYAAFSSLTMENLTFSGNKGWYGGGATILSDHVTHATSNLTNVLFVANSAESFGGGLVIQNRVTVHVKDTRFEDNISAFLGGGVVVYADALATFTTTATFEDVSFTGNQSQSHGGAIYTDGKTDLTLVDALISRNATTTNGQGGGIYQTGGVLKISRTEISRNTGWDKGGGAALVNVDATMSNVKFLGNYVSPADTPIAIGGGLYIEQGSLINSNLLFSGNRSDNAGAIYMRDLSITFSNMTIGRQQAPYADSNVFTAHGIVVDGGNDGQDSAILQNSILWLDGQKAIALINSGGYFGGNTIFQGPDGPMNSFGIMSVSAFPFLVAADPGNDGFGDNPYTDADESANDNYGDLRLNGTTRVLDAGDNSKLPTDPLDINDNGNTTEKLPIDLAGNIRVLRMVTTTAIVDPGAYEYVNASPTAKIVQPSPINEAGSIELDATGSTDDGGIASYQWDCTNDNSTDVTEDSPTQGLCTYPNSGNYTLRLTVVDNLGATDTTTTSVTVNNIAPTFTPGSNQTTSAGAATSFSLGSFTDPGAEGIWSISVDWGDDTTPTQFTVSSTGALPDKSHAYAAQGTYDVVVTVSDDAGNHSGTFEVEVSAALPGTPSITPPSSQQGAAGREQLFALGSFSDSNSSGPWLITIDWGDDSPVTQFSVTSSGEIPAKPHTYAKGGIYEVFVTVSDGVLSSTISFQVTIPVQESGTLYLPSTRKE